MKRKITYLILALMLSVTFTGCGKKDTVDENNKAEENVKDVDLISVKNALKEALGSDYLPDMEFDKTYVEETLGLTSDMYDDIIAEGRKVSFFIDTFIAVKAKDGAKVEEKLNAYRDSLINDSMVYPTNAVKLQTSMVIRHGKYVFFVCLGEIPQETVEAGDEAILKVAKEKNEKAKNAIDSCFK